jgi:UPF0755 protein
VLRRLGLLALLVALGGAILVTREGVRWWQAPGPLGAPRIVVIAKGGTRAIAAQLGQAGIVDRPLWFSVIAKLTGEARAFKAGEYLFPAAATPAAVADRLDRGDVVVHRLVIPEGLTTVEVLAIVAAAPVMTGSVAAPPTEGQILPNTYFYVYGQSRQAIIDRMRREMARAVATLWAERAPGVPLQSPAQAVVLASIVEKETALPAERPLIAQVFYNRLRRGMKLQSDPTVIYALTQGRGALGRSLTHDDVAFASPYNTYATPGLPPGPIANPGRAALEAVLHPEPTDALYFVANGEGGHSFAVTLREQDRNIAAWRAKRHMPAP